MARLTRTRKILHEIHSCIGQHTYRHEDDEPDARPATTVYVNDDDYHDMGRPDTITLTIEPGDHLND